MIPHNPTEAIWRIDRSKYVDSDSIKLLEIHHMSLERLQNEMAVLLAYIYTCAYLVDYFIQGDLEK